jgi:hypothetical protein
MEVKEICLSCKDEVEVKKWRNQYLYF